MGNTIHLVDGEIGGLGKSIWSCVLVEYNNKYDFLYTLIDGDAGNPNVQQRYPEVELANWLMQKRLHFCLRLKRTLFIETKSQIWKPLK